MTNLDYLKPFGVDFFCVGKKFLVFNLVGRNLKVKYRRSVLGVLWTLVSPLSMVFVFYFVFKVVMRVQMPHYLAFLVSGIIPWSYYAQTVLEGMESLVGNGPLVSKVPIPLQVFPLVGAVTNFVTFALAIPILIGVTLFSGIPVNGSMLLFPVFYISLFFMSYAFSLLLGILNVYFRDMKHLTSILMQLWFYGTPVLYSADMVPAKYHWVLLANPIAGCFIGFHKIISEGAYPPLDAYYSTLGWTLASLVASFVILKYSSRNLVESL